MTFELTNLGRQILLKAAAGETEIVFTKMQIGDGAKQNPLTAAALKSVKIDNIAFTKFQSGIDFATLTAVVSNSELNSGFRITEAGVFVKDPNSTTNEILYAVGFEDSQTADYVPSKSERLIDLQFDIAMYIGTAENISATLADALGYNPGVGKSLAGKMVTPISTGSSVTAETGAEILNDYRDQAQTGLNKTGNIAVGKFALATGSGTTALGECSTATGSATQANGTCSYAGGSFSSANGNMAFATGFGAQANGNYSFAAGSSVQANGNYAIGGGKGTNAYGDCSFAVGMANAAYRLQTVIGRYADTDATGGSKGGVEDNSTLGSLFVVGGGLSASNTANVFRVSAAGAAYASQSVNGTGADSSEFFEWLDGNPNEEDRRGRFVTLDGEKVKIASPGDYIAGVVVAPDISAFIGNTASEEWCGKWSKDIFGSYVTQEVVNPSYVDADGNKHPAESVISRVLNPDYDPNRQYIPREERTEWAVISLMGQVVIIDDGTCTVNGYCKPSVNGVGTASDSGYRVLKRLDESHIKILVK